MSASRHARAAEAPLAPILHLEVETDDCPQALLRVLNLLVLQGLSPLTIAAERRAYGHHMLLGLEPIHDRRAELLLHKLQAIVTVARAAYLRPE